MTRKTTNRRALLMALTMLFGIALSPLAGLAAPAAAATGGGVQVVAQLHLLDLECLAENDGFGSDEPYININGQRVWSRGNVDRGDIELVNLRFDFDEVVTVELWEDDGGLSGRDDLMGRWFFFASEAGGGITKVRSQFTTGLYDLRYEVVTP
jgi:hypothetical protein